MHKVYGAAYAYEESLGLDYNLYSEEIDFSEYITLSCEMANEPKMKYEANPTKKKELSGSSCASERFAYAA